jgi:hypothetical protein
VQWLTALYVNIILVFVSILAHHHIMFICIHVFVCLVPDGTANCIPLLFAPSMGVAVAAEGRCCIVISFPCNLQQHELNIQLVGF